MKPNFHITFLDYIFSELKNLSINTDELVLDHIAYQAKDKEDFDIRKKGYINEGELVREPIVGGRSISIIELIEPVEGTKPKSALEHAEFLVKTSLEEFIEKYSHLDWNTSKLNREEFPMLVLRLNEHLQVKFPRKSVLVS